MKILSLILIFTCFFLTSPVLPAKKAETADIIFKNGNIYTVNDRQSKAESIAIKGNKIIFVGENSEVSKYESKTTKVIDLKGNTVVPGFTDSHCHLREIGTRELTLNLEGTTSLNDFLAKVKARVEQVKPGEWVTGLGWIETFWQPAVFPTRYDLDKISPNNPVYLERADGHGAVVNSLALKIARINKDTANPFGGEILKDKETKEPTGMILDKAHDLVIKHIPALTPEYIEKAVLVGVKRSLELGWCQLHDAGGTYAEVELFRRLYKEGKIKLRIHKAIHGPSFDAERLMKEGATAGSFDGLFNFRTIKVVFDGALGSRGAALLAPYSDFDTSGFLIHKEEVLFPMLVKALKSGIQVQTHAIGDRANRTILDLYEKAFATVPEKDRKLSDPRWRIEHAQVLNSSDLNRFSKLGIIASMQPSHAISDLHFAPKRLGQERLSGAYAWQDLLKTGVIIAAGSDAPVERGEPMIEFYASVARKDQKGFSGEGWHLEQKVSRQQALKMLTIWPAQAAFEEQIKGSIEVGKLADLTILSADIMIISEPEILKTKCLMTIVNGEILFDSLK